MAFRYKFFVSADGKNWKEVPTNGEFSNIMHNPLPQTVAFGQKVQARYIKLEALSISFNDDNSVRGLSSLLFHSFPLLRLLR